MTRVLMIGYGPLPDEPPDKQRQQRVSASGLRTWHFLSVLRAAGHDICLIAGRDYGSYPDNTPDVISRTVPGWKYHSVSDTYLRNPAAIRALIGAWQADCAVSVTTTASAIASAWIGDLPLWADLYGSIMAEAQMKALVYGDDRYLSYFWQLERSAIERAARFSTVSDRQRWALIGELGAVGRLNQWTSGYEFATTIPIASETSPYVPAARRVIRGVCADADAFVILYSGGYNTWTDVETLFNALEQILRTYPNVVFVSTGGQIDGHDSLTYGRFQNMIEHSAYHTRYQLCGWVPAADLAAYYLESNVGISVDRPSYEAQLGSRTRILDWMRAGLPSISSSLTELSEQIVAAQAGFAYAPGNVADLVRCLRFCIDQRAETAAMGFRARQLLLDRFTFEGTTTHLREWVATPTHAPDFGRGVPKLNVTSGTSINIRNALSRRLLFALRLWPLIVRVTDRFGLRRVQNVLLRIGKRALHLNRSPYRVQYIAWDVPSIMQTDERYTCTITLRNWGRTAWISARDSETGVNLSYHWLTEQNVMHSREGLRSLLPGQVAARQTITAQMDVRAPSAPGRYQLQLDLVREGVIWFGDAGSPGPSLLIEVRSADLQP